MPQESGTNLSQHKYVALPEPEYSRGWDKTIYNHPDLTMGFIYHQRDIFYIIHLGAVSIRKTVLPGMAIPMLKIRRPNGRLIFNMEISIRR